MGSSIPHCWGPLGKEHLMKPWSEWIQESGSWHREDPTVTENLLLSQFGSMILDAEPRRVQGTLDLEQFSVDTLLGSGEDISSPSWCFRAQGAALQETKEETQADSHAHPSSPSSSHKCRHTHPSLLPLLYTEWVKPDLSKFLSTPIYSTCRHTGFA